MNIHYKKRNIKNAKLKEMKPIQCLIKHSSYEDNKIPASKLLGLQCTNTGKLPRFDPGAKEIQLKGFFRCALISKKDCIVLA